MAVSTDDQRIKASHAVTMYDFDPNSTSATAVAWVDMRDFSSFLATFMRTVGTSALTMIVQASAASNGSSPTTVKSKTVSYEPDAVGDYLHVEVSDEEIRQAGVDAGIDARYVSLTLTFATGTDEGVVTYVREGKRKHKDLSSDNIAA